MADTASLHVVPHDGNWALKREGTSSPEKTFDTQAEAIESGRSMAIDENNELIIHRSNGRIRNVLNYEEPDERESLPENDRARNGQVAASERNTDSDAERTTDRDRNVDRGVPIRGGVASRISWGSLFGGFVTALSLYVTLTLLGWAIATSLEATTLKTSVLKTVWGVWMILSLLTSLVVGGFTISRLTLGEDSTTEPIIYGTILWGIMIILTPLVIGFASLNLGFGAANVAGRLGTSAAVEIPRSSWETAEFSEAQIATIEKTMADATSVGGPSRSYLPNEIEAAWLSFVAVLLSLLAAIMGCIWGANSEVDERFRRLGGVRTTAT